MLAALLLLYATGLVSSLTLWNKEKPSGCGYDSCTQAEADVLNVHIVPHTHDDVGWLKTVDQYYYGSRSHIQKAGVQYILDSVIKELWEDPKRRYVNLVMAQGLTEDGVGALLTGCPEFIYVETAFFWKWWTEQTEAVRNMTRALVREGRLQFVGGAWSMNDEAASHYQSTVDQFTRGLKKLNETFGACATPHVGWQIDPFGHSREFASLLAAMGYDGLFLGRIDYEDKANRLQNKAMEMLWRGDDDLGKASDIFTGVLYNTYSPPPGFCFDVLCNDEPIIDDANSPIFNVDKRITAFLKYIRRQAEWYTTNNAIVTMGGDFTYQDATMWYKNLDKLIKYTNLRAAQEGLKVKLFYSTPNCYLKAVRDANPSLPTKKDDFFPYASDPHSYWTGYFTSRPTTKYFERQGNGYLQMYKQLQVLTQLEEHNSFVLAELEDAMGIMQHHDAITGTEKQHVAHDYERILDLAIEDGSLIAKQAFNKIMQGDALKPPILQYNRCRLNESSCYTSENSQQFVVTIYNALAWEVKEPIRVPVKAGTYEVYAPNGQEISSQLVEIPPQVLAIPTRSSEAKYEVVFIAYLKPMSFKSFYVKKFDEKVDMKTKGGDNTDNTRVKRSLEGTPNVRSKRAVRQKLDLYQQLNMLLGRAERTGRKPTPSENAEWEEAEKQMLTRKKSGLNWDESYKKSLNRKKPIPDWEGNYKKPFNRKQLVTDWEENYKKPFNRKKPVADWEESYKKPVPDWEENYKKHFNRKKPAPDWEEETETHFFNPKKPAPTWEGSEYHYSNQKEPVPNWDESPKYREEIVPNWERTGRNYYQNEPVPSWDEIDKILSQRKDTLPNYEEKQKGFLKHTIRTFGKSDSAPEKGKYNPDKANPMAIFKRSVGTEPKPDSIPYSMSKEGSHVNSPLDAHIDDVLVNGHRDGLLPSAEIDILIKEVAKSLRATNDRRDENYIVKRDSVAFFPTLSEEERRMLSDAPFLASLNDDMKIGWSNDVQLHFSSTSTPDVLKLNHVTLPDGTDVRFNMALMYYPGCEGDNNKPEKRASGAYIFRPNSTAPKSVNSTINRGPTGEVVQELRLTTNTSAAAFIRVYKDLSFIEVEWVVGPIDIKGNIGKEFIVKYNTDLINNGEFYTDSNGRQMIKRTLNKRPQWNLTIAEPVGGNYYPVTNKIFIKDEKVRFSVLTDRSEGGSSLEEGALELMVHRRLLHDDAFGVGEALNETANGKGLVARGKHRLLFSDVNNKQQYIDEKKHVLQYHLEPKVFISDAKEFSLEAWMNISRCHSWINELPEGLHLLTLEPWSYGSMLLRLENYLEKADKENADIDVDIRKMFKSFELLEIRETTLAANQWLSDDDKWSWNTVDSAKEVSNNDAIDENFRNEPKDNAFKVKIKAKEIRTFVVTYKV